MLGVREASIAVCMQTVRVGSEVSVEDRNLLGTGPVAICVTSGKNLAGLCTGDSGVLKMSGMWDSWKAN